MKNPKPVYKTLAKTVVTEIKHAVVGGVRREGQSMHTVATRVSRATMTETEVVVGPDKTMTLKDVSNILSIFSPHPIVAEFIGFGAIPPEDEDETEQIFFDATIEVGRADAGRFISVKVIDMDVYTPAPLQAEIVNMRTGETEYVTLTKESDGIYTGFVQTQNNTATGTNFDGVLYCRVDDVLQVTYEEPYAANGKSREVVQTVVTTLAFKPTEIQAPDSVPFGGLLNLRVYNPTTSTVTVKNNRTGHIITQQLGNFQPILMQYTDTETEMDTQNDDVIVISTVGRGPTEADMPMSKTIRIAGAPVAPKFIAPDVADVTIPLGVVVIDFNQPQQAQLAITNGNTNVTTLFPMQEEYTKNGHFVATIPTLTSLGLPGHLLVLKYITQGGLTVTKNVPLIMPATEECAAPPPESAPVSSPVVFNINGLFMLNGSFAGTIKLSAPDLVRCTIIKA